MSANVEDRHDPIPVDAAADWTLRRWHVSYRSGAAWYPVGEFVALTAAAAIERAVEVFGPGSEYQADEIPWDAAPLPRVKPTVPRGSD
jgi:hypothetical protein